MVSAPACAQTVPTLGPRASSSPAQGDLPPSPEGSVHAHRFPGPAPPPFVPSAAQRLLYSLPHFLGSQGHHHLGDRGSLLQRDKTLTTVYMARRSHSPGHPDTATCTPRRRVCISLSLRAEAEPQACSSSAVSVTPLDSQLPEARGRGMCAFGTTVPTGPSSVLAHGRCSAGGVCGLRGEQSCCLHLCNPQPELSACQRTLVGWTHEGCREQPSHLPASPAVH